MTAPPDRPPLPQPRIPTRVWYLAMRDPARLSPAADPGPHVAVRHAAIPSAELSRFFYEEVGRAHHWVDRLAWTDEHWQVWAESVETWLLYERDTPAGYAQLARRPRDEVYIAFFGLLPRFQGRGLGGHFLSEIVRGAWEDGAAKVTLDTCELDGRHARRNYERRGFEVIREATEARGRSREAAPA